MKKRVSELIDEICDLANDRDVCFDGGVHVNPSCNEECRTYCVSLMDVNGELVYSDDNDVPFNASANTLVSALSRLKKIVSVESDRDYVVINPSAGTVSLQHDYENSSGSTSDVNEVCFHVTSKEVLQKIIEQMKVVSKKLR